MRESLIIKVLMVFYMKTIFYNHMHVFTYIVGHLYHAKQTYLMYFHIEVKTLKKGGNTFHLYSGFHFKCMHVHLYTQYN